MGADPGPSWKVVGTGDFNDDGHSDILWQNTRTGRDLGNERDERNRRGNWWAPILGRVGRRSERATINGDGHSDILWQNTSGQAAIWEMNGTNVIGGGLVGANPGPSWLAKA